ncbi:YqzL family protein [Alkaliphilus sp. MSJ-5]|uniref:YqzL family protein n=1 Tax=Alkaliphilus flagellatus TaxID=2841507 RepID=A0ABS6FZK3_9FIRM|nr:YqzL family protein [Alkaliphilus flagellatus]MBU5675683.1 YqzL family protein [Alkaliphilus flagellatus]
MLNETMWNIFKETGNIYAYLYTKDYDKHCSNNNTVNKKAPLEMKEITII